jgi:hypothetical protein
LANKRHKKEVAGLVSGEIDLSRTTAAISVQLLRFVVCASAHIGEAIRKVGQDYSIRTRWTCSAS